jgi:hypothetical protein
LARSIVDESAGGHSGWRKQGGKSILGRQLRDFLCVNPQYRFFQYYQSISVLLPHGGKRRLKIWIGACHSEPLRL